MKHALERLWAHVTSISRRSIFASHPMRGVTRRRRPSGGGGGYSRVLRARFRANALKRAEERKARREQKSGMGR